MAHGGGGHHHPGGSHHHSGGSHHRGRSRGRGRGRRRWSWLGQSAAPVSSPLVAWAQSCLAQLLGDWVPQDGILGAATRQAISQFQTQQQLPSTGALDDDTVSALQAACAQPSAQDAPPQMPAPPPPMPAPPPQAPPPPQASAAAHRHHPHAPPSGEIAGGEGELSFQEGDPVERRHTGRWVRQHDRIILIGV